MPQPGTKWKWTVEELPADQQIVWIRPLNPAFKPTSAQWIQSNATFQGQGPLAGFGWPGVLVPMWKPQ
jgi:hypothetical protein